MGKQKLTAERVELVKYFLDKKELTHQEIGNLVGVGRGAVTHIKNENRWREVELPSTLRGELLYYKLLNNELK